MATKVKSAPHVTTANQPDSLVERREAQRYAFHMPVVLFTRHAPEPTLYSSTEDVSYYGFTALLKWDLPKGAIVDFLINSPFGEIQGEARVARTEIRRLASFPFSYCYVEFVRFEEGGRKAIDALLDPRNHDRLEPVLLPQNKRRPVSIMRPLMMFLALCFPLCILTLGAFRYYYSDDFFLHSVDVGSLELTAENVARIDEIYQATMRKGYPSTDRLVLLMSALTKAHKEDEVDQITLILAPRDRNNTDLQIALAQSLDDTKDHESAERTYQRLLILLDKGKISASKRREIMLAAARNRVHSGEFAKAGEFYQQLLEGDPDDMALRNEYAAVLLGADQCAEAIKLYQNVEPDIAGRYLLVSIYAQMKDYDAAERECRKIVALQPNDPQAELLLADVLSWKKGDYSQSKAIYERLAKARAGDPALRLRLAQIALWSKRYDEALARFQSLIEEAADPSDAFKNPGIINGFVDAASSADDKQLTDQSRKLARSAYDYVLANASDNAILLSRLAWVMQRLKEPEASTLLLDRAVAINPDNPEVRKQMFGLLIQNNRIDDAMALVQGKQLDREDRKTLIGMYCKNDNFEAAARECRTMLQQSPDDLEMLRRLADILSWNKEYAESLQLFDRLIKAQPNDAELKMRQAEVTLWSGNVAEAVRRFAALLTAKFDQPELWPGYIDSVAGLKTATPTDEQKRLVVQIYDHVINRQGDPKALKVKLSSLAWALQSYDKKRAETVLQRAVATPPTTSEQRKELANVLAALGKYAEAVKLYEGIELKPEDKLELARLQMASQDFVAAAKTCRDYLQEKPQDKDARKLMADILSYQKDYPAALAMLEQLIDEYPSDLSYKVSRAEVTVWSGAFDKALQLVMPLLDAKFDQPDLWGPYIDAASGIKELSPETGRYAVQIYEAIKPDLQKKVEVKGLSLARLAWVLWRLDRKPAASALLEQLRNANVGGITEGEQLVDVMAAAGKFQEAIPIIEKMIKENPNRPELRIKLAETLLWSGRYDESLKNFQTLLAAKFDQPKLWDGFIDAAASATQPLDAEQGKIAESIAAQIKTFDLKQATYLARVAYVLYRGGKFEKANILLDKVIALNPQEVPVREYLASVLGSVGRFDAALAIIEPLVKSEPTNLERQIRMAELTLGARNYDKAIVMYEQLLEQNFDQPKLWKGFIDAAAKATKLTEKQANLSVKIAEKASPSDDKSNVEMLTRMTWVLARTGEQDLAGEVIDRVLAAHPRDLATQRQLAEMLTAAGNFQSALPIYEEIVKDHPESTEFLLPLANVTLWCKKYDLALARFQPLLEADFEQPKVWESFIDSASSAADVTPAQIKIALRIADQPIIRASDNVAILSRLAWVLLRGNETKRANELLDRAIALKPETASIRRELAGVLTAADRFEDAVKIYEQLLKELPQDSELPYLIADALLGKGDYREAMTRFESMLKVQFDQPNVWRGYVSAAAKAEELTGAQKKMVERILEQVQQRGSKDPRLLSRLAWVILRDEKRTELALQLLEQAYKLGSKEPSVKKELAGIMSAAGNPKTAIELYQGLPMKRDDHFRLANIYATAKEFVKAEKELRIIVDSDKKDEEALRLLADVLSWGKKFVESKKIFRQLLQAHPGDQELEIKLARVTLWSSDYEAALEEFYRILQKDHDQALLYRDFIDSAAGVKPNVELDTKYQKLLLYICDRLDLEELKKEPDFLVRVSWVLRRMKQLTRAIGMLEQALKANPKARQVRLQYAETLLEAGRAQEAERQFDMLLRGTTNGSPGR